MLALVTYACVSVAAYLLYRQLSQTSKGGPTVTDTAVLYATQAPNPLIANDVSVLTSARVETPEQLRVTLALL